MKLKVGYLPVSVAYVDDVEANDGAYLARYSSQTASITIKNGLPPAKQASALVHELIHAVFDAHDLKDERLCEEEVCSLLDGPLTALFTDNPQLGAVLHQAVHHDRPILGAPLGEPGGIIPWTF